MMSFVLPHEMAKKLAEKVRNRRLEKNWSQKTLASRAAVALATLKKFEQTGKISLESLLRIALILGALEGFESLFPDITETATTLAEIMKDTSRKRGRR